MNQQEKLISLIREKDFFIGIDSDGCVFDTMEIKHKECFCPNFIKYFNLQVISKYARETWEFVNLYSQSRGCNRFQAIIRAIDLLKERTEVIARNAKLPDLSPVSKWMKTETKLGNPALEKYSIEVKNEIIYLTLNWSKAVNKSIEDMVSGMPPFSFVNESLKNISEKADLMVVSQTPYEALKREWEENNLDSYLRIIAGQESGTKTEHLKYAAKGKYPENRILMIGDAPGDLLAAKANGVLFFPVNPGYEEASWELFMNEASEKFFKGTFAGAYEETLINDFQKLLPENPSWK
jgi:phosphoglycolate phosphatase-like HAD superfamily hydrolase